MLTMARRNILRVTAGLVLILFIAFFGLPLVWLVLASSKTYYQLQTEFPFSLGTWDGLVANWNQILSIQGGAFLGWLRNSAFYSLGGLALMLLASIPAGYALARTRLRVRKPLLLTTLVVMLMPSTALVLPTFLELNWVGLIGNPLAAILPFSFFPFGVYLTCIHFATAVPQELLAAARIDGCSELQVFLRIAVPLAAPVIALVAFFNFVQSWTNYFLPFVVLPGSDGYTVQVGLSTVGREPSPLAIVIATIPIVVLFLGFQRFVLSGKTTGALAAE
jgi:multiple sugar transport system permease protein